MLNKDDRLRDLERTMTKIKEITDRSACAAWCPVNSHPDLVVLGTKDSGAGFDDTGGTLELFDLKLSSNDDPVAVASLKTVTRFASVDWSPYHGDRNQHPLGLIAGGMTDGSVHVWDAFKLQQNISTEPLCTVKRHANGKVSALSFHPLEPWKLATGGSDGLVLVIDISKSSGQPEVVDPTPGSKQSGEITAVAWNSQVAHILASASADGSVGVWDLKQCKSWCKLQVEHGAVSDVGWNPREGLYLLTASGDDRDPVLKVFDLGASTSMPLTTMTGHSAGILKTAWCPHDDTLLLSCSKDNRTFLWDLVRLQAIAELPAEHDEPDRPKSSPNQLFASGSISEQKHMRVFTAWSPLKRGLALTCSLDRKVQVHSVLALATQSGRPPKWMKPASAVSTGFGGTVISVGSSNNWVTVQTVQEKPELAVKSMQFEVELASKDITEFCESRQQKYKPGSVEEKLWGFMSIIFQQDARERLLAHLGFDAQEIAQAATEYGEDTSNGIASMSLGDKPGVMTPAAQETVKRALVVGNFDAAVECCFQVGNYADGLLLAYSGGADLWAKTQSRYFEDESTKRPYLSLLSSIVNSQWEDLVPNSDPSKWKETLAILSSYAQSEDFPRLCIALGDRLEEAGDFADASLCYMCSLNLEQSAKYWVSQYEKVQEKSDSLDISALHDLVVKVTVFMRAVGSTAPLPDTVAELFTKYSQALAEQGLFATAARYSKGTSMEAMVLRDRLYRSRESQSCLAELSAAPEFPYSMENINRGQYQAAQAQSNASVGGGSVHSVRSQPSSRQNAVASSVAPSTPTKTTPASDELPPGWIALQDPSSGMTYYANQTTGESTWERPQPVPMTPQPTASLDASNRSLHTQSSNVSQSSSSSKKASLVSKYGDGFVTSASHPELANRYGNVGTSNPYTGVSRPGTAAAVVNATTNAPAPAPDSGPVDVNAVQLSAEQAQIRDTLLALLEHITSVAFPSEKRQLDESRKAIEVLVKKFARGGIDEEVQSKLLQMVNAITTHDFRGASSIQTALVSSDWRDHKDWLKGMKILIQLAVKKYH